MRKGFPASRICTSAPTRKTPKTRQTGAINASDEVYFYNYVTNTNAPYPQQNGDLPNPHPMVVPIPRAGLMGSFMPSPKEISLEVTTPLEKK